MTDEKDKKTRSRRGDGSLHQRANGLWIGRVELPPDPVTGRRRQKQVSGMDYRDVVKKRNRLRRELQDHGDLPTASMTLAKWMDYWLENVNKSRPKTRAAYRSHIRHIRAAIGRIKLEKLGPDDVRALERYIVEKQGLSATTALQSYRILSRALKDAEREGRVLRNVAQLVDPPRKAVASFDVLTVDEGITVLRSVAEDRLGSRIAAALLTGARQGELLGLEIDRVNFEKDTIELSWQLQSIPWRHGCASPAACRTRGTDCPKRRLDAAADWEHRHLGGTLYLSRPKSRSGWRTIPLVDPLRSILERRIAVAETEPNPHGLVWTADPKRHKTTKVHLPLDGAPIDPSRDNKAWHAALERAGVTDMRLHDARHTAVTILLDLGVPESVVMAIVGHSTVAMTRSYRKMNEGPLREALQALSKALEARLSEPERLALDAA